MIRADLGAPAPLRDPRARRIIRCGRLLAGPSVRYDSGAPPPTPALTEPREQRQEPVSLEPPAKFFVNSGLVSNPVDIFNVLRPLLKQTVSYRYLRGQRVVSRGTGWVERIVIGRPSISTFFTPLSICLNVDSFEHLEFETRPDQLLVYTLVQGDERVVVEYAPTGERQDPDEPVQQALQFQSPGYVQMELTAFDSSDDWIGEGPGLGPDGPDGG